MAEENPYAELVRERDQGQTAQLRTTIQQATGQPDRAAETRRYADRYGLPPSVVDGNFDAFKERARVDDGAAAAKDAPKLGEWMAADRANADVAHDDLPQLGKLERTLSVGRNLAGAAAAGVAGFSAGVWGALQAGAESFDEATGTKGFFDAAFARDSAAVASHLADRLRGTQEGAGFVERAIYGGAESVGQMGPGLVLGAVAGPAALLTAAGVATGGQAYSQARREGVTVGPALAFAGGQGAIEVATEYIPAKRLLGDLAAKSGLLTTLMHQIASEVPGEEVATLLQDLNEWAVLPSNKDRPFADYLRERPSAAAATLISTIVAVGSTTVAAHGTAHLLEQLGAGVEESKTMQRSPAAAEAYLAHATKGTPLETVYAPIDTFTTYWQKQGLDPAAVASELTGDPKAYQAALESGQDLPIPTAAYAVKIGATEHGAFFVNELRLEPDQMNGREAEELGKADPTPAAAEPEPVRQALQQQLEAAGFKAEDAATQAGLYAETFGTLAERAGVDPFELFAQYGLQVARPDVAPGTATAPSGRQAAPTAVFAHYDEAGPVYDIIGGPSDGSSQHAAGLEAAGIAIPETPADTGERLNGEQLRARALAKRGTPLPAPVVANLDLQAENRRLTRQLETDPQTGVGSGRAFTRARLAAEADPETSVVAFDANNFGKVNKVKGDAAGDEMIVAIAQALTAAATEVGMGARVFRLREGGDEFAILAPQAIAEQVRERAEAIFGAQAFEGNEKIPAFEVSISGSVGTTYADADSRLQAAKNARKDAQVRAAEALRGRRPGAITDEEIHAAEVSAAHDAGLESPDLAEEQPDVDPSGLAEGSSDADRAGRRFPLPDPDGDDLFVRVDAAGTAARLTPGVLAEVGRILEELETFEYHKRIFNPEQVGRGHGGDIATADTVVGTESGASVYHDVLYLAPRNKGRKKGTVAAKAHGTRDVVKAATRALLASEPAINTNLQEGVIRVAERRDAGEWQDLTYDITVLGGKDINRLYARPFVADQLEADVDAIERGDELAPDAEDDTSFDVTTFNQSALASLFDDLAAEPEQPAPLAVAQLEALATDEAMGVEFPTDQPSHFPNGDDAVVCTNCAERIIELLGEGEVYGWEEGANPSSVVAGPTQGAHVDDGQGHDFAIIRDRFLVDAWAKNVEGSSARAAFDLADPTDRAEVARLYGDPATWMHRGPAPDYGWTEGAGVALMQQVDTLDTGEQQPRLPGAEDVREAEVATPQLEAPFSLTSEAAKGSKGKQTTLFQESLPVVPTFYSRLTRAVEDSKQAKASGAQWKATIRNAKIGINKDEFALARVADLEDGTSYTKQEVLDYLAANQIDVVDVTLDNTVDENERERARENLDEQIRDRADGIFATMVDLEVERLEESGDLDAGRPETRVEQNEDGDGWTAYVDDDDLGYVYDTEEEAQADADTEADRQSEANAADASERIYELARNRVEYRHAEEQARQELTPDEPETDERATRYGDYVEPGEVEPGSYREVFLAVPDLKPTGPTFDPALVRIERTSRSITQGNITLWYGDEKLQTYEDDRIPAGGGAWVSRLNDDYWRDVAERLFKEGDKINGIKGRQQGRWKDGHSEYDDVVDNPIVRLRFNIRRTGRPGFGMGERVLFLEEVQPPQAGQRVPELFQKNWRELAFKWALRYAAERDLGAVAWTTGQMQADRYSLEKQVESIQWGRVDEGGTLEQMGAHRFVSIDTKQGTNIRAHIDAKGIVLALGSDPNVRRWAGAPLENVIGKEVAAKITEKEAGSLEGEGLKIGGEGLKRLYDVDFRNVVQGLPAVKRLGGKVETVKVVTKLAPVRDEGERAIGVEERTDIAGETFYVLRLANQKVVQLAAHSFADANALLKHWNETYIDGRPESLAVDVPALKLTPALREAVLGGQTLFQDPETPRGSITFTDAKGRPVRQVQINLFAAADLSTFLHETGHFFLGVMGDLVERVQTQPADQHTPGQRQLLDDYAAILAHLGVAARGELQTKHEEDFARTFEAYLMTGQAPSVELRSAFHTFRAWLLGVYRSLRRLRVDLTPEVTQVLDRMLASDRAIAAAEAEGHVAPMFLTPEAAGMTPAQFALYEDTVLRASRVARERLEQQLMAEVQREQTARWKAQRAEIRARVEDTVNAQPVYRAIAAMQHGTNPDGSPLVEGLETPPVKLSKAIIVARHGEHYLRALPRPYVYTVEGGMDPNTVAGLFGFSSGDELLQAVVMAQPRKQLIEQQTDAQMIAEHGSLLLDGTLHDQATAAVANEDREAVLRAEWRALRALQRTVKPHVRALENQARRGPATIAAGLPNPDQLREAARTRIGRLTPRTLKPASFWSAAVRASKLATEAAAKQDFAAAIEAKQQELLNLALYREAQRTLDDVGVRVARAKALAQPAARKRLGLAGKTYLQQVDGVLDRYEFADVPAKQLEARARIREWVEALEAQGLPVDDLTPELLDDARRVNYQDVSIDELRGITDGLAQIQHLARLKLRLLKNADDRDFRTIRDELVGSIGDNGDAKPKRLEFRSGDDKKRAIGDWFASHTKIAILARALDGHTDGGPAWEAIIRPLNAAADDEVTRKKAEGKRLQELLEEHYPGRELGKLHELRHIPAINGSLSYEGRLAVALNWGNQTSRDRLLADPVRQWTQGQVESILDTLDERDWRFVQATWDYVNTFWPEIAAKQERVTGLAPDKVEATVVKTRFGDQRGGYYPLTYDGRLVARAQQHEAATESKLQTAAAYVRTTTKRGHVEARKRNVQLSVKLDLGVLFGHVEQVLHDLTHHEALIDVTRVLRDRKVAAAIYETKGDVVYQQFTRALQDIAIGTKPATNVLDRSANWMRTRTQIALLGFNLWTGAQQPLGLFNGASRVGAKWVVKGMTRWLRDAASMESTTTWINEVSPMMRARGLTATQDLADLRAGLRKPGGWFDDLVRRVSRDTLTQQTIVDSYLWHIGLMQRVADVPTWLGQYEKSMHAGEDEARAIALADQAVLDSQGGGQIKDLAQVQRGGPIARLFMTFYSYGNTVFNATADVAGATDFKSPAQVGTFLGHLSLLYIMPAVGAVLLSRALGRSDDDEPFWRELAGEALSAATNTMVLVREAGSAAQLALGFDPGARGYGGPAGLRPFQLVYQLAQQVNQGEPDEALFKALNAVGGVLFRYPAAQVQRTVDGWIALTEGRTRNPGALFVGAPKEAR